MFNFGWYNNLFRWSHSHSHNHSLKAIDGTSTTWGDITTYTQGSAGTGVNSTIGLLLHFHKEQLVMPNLGAGNSLTGQFVSEITIFD